MKYYDEKSGLSCDDCYENIGGKLEDCNNQNETLELAKKRGWLHIKNKRNGMDSCFCSKECLTSFLMRIVKDLLR